MRTSLILAERILNALEEWGATHPEKELALEIAAKILWREDHEAKYGAKPDPEPVTGNEDIT
jgi:hypothetical protein